MADGSTQKEFANSLDRVSRQVHESASRVAYGTDPTLEKATLIVSLVQLGAELSILQEQQGCLQRGSVGVAIGVAAQLLAEEIKNGGWAEFGLDTATATAH